MGCTYERKHLAGTDCVGCTCDQRQFHMYNCIFSSTIHISVFEHSPGAHDLILPSVCARRAYPQRFLGRVGRTPLSPTLTWRQFQMPSRKGALSSVCYLPEIRSSVSSYLVQYHYRQVSLVRVSPKQTVFNPFPRRHSKPPPSECGR